MGIGCILANSTITQDIFTPCWCLLQMVDPGTKMRESQLINVGHTNRSQPRRETNKQYLIIHDGSLHVLVHFVKPQEILYRLVHRRTLIFFTHEATSLSSLC